MLIRLLFVFLVALTGCDGEEDCDAPVAAYCDAEQRCDDDGDFERVLDTARSDALDPVRTREYEVTYIRACRDRIIVRLGDGFGGFMNTYDADSGELESVTMYSDVVVEGYCTTMRYGEHDFDAPCEDACLLLGYPLLGEGNDPLCEGPIAEPVIELCQTIAAEEYEPACAECACRECYAQVVDPRRGEANDEGEIIPTGCLDEHCTQECQD